MIKLLLGYRYAPIYRKIPQLSFWFSDSPTVPIPIHDDGPYHFQRQVIGFVSSLHVLPYTSRHSRLSPENMYICKEMSLNYIVILVRKVLDQSINISGIDPDQKLKDQFYSIATYCKLQVIERGLQVRGLFRVSIDSIDSIKVPKMQGADVKAKMKLEQSRIINESQEVFEEEAAMAGDKHVNKHPFELYKLTVTRLYDQPLILDHNLNIKFKSLIELYTLHLNGEHPQKFIFNPHDISININKLMSTLPIEQLSVSTVQKYLEQSSVEARMTILRKEIERATIQKSVINYYGLKGMHIIRNKKLYKFYNQMMLMIKQQLEKQSTKKKFIRKCTLEFEANKPPEAVRQAFNEEMEKFMSMQENLSEYSVTKNYLENLSRIPFGKKTEEVYDLEFAKQTLESQHYGMKDVKETILEILAVGKLKGSLKGKIICLIGGPGLGKTSIAKSIAKALQREYYSISLGGVNDSSDLKGHRRTYIAAAVGKIIAALQQCKTNNPVILLDEIDKLGKSYHGDPRSQLLQILDPNQNASFVDNFIGVPVDLSNVVFICSANYENNISKPLLDRLEIIRLLSYTDEQKIEIFKRHLIRRAIDKAGVNQDQFVISDEIIKVMINEYTFGESGVRELEKLIEKIVDKIAYKIVSNEEKLPIIISKQNLPVYLENSHRRIRDHSKIKTGVAIGLGGHIGRLTYIEAFKKSFMVKPKPLRIRETMFTGSLGDVMKETMDISYTFTRNFLRTELKNNFLYENQVHIHAPEGAQKKDGSTDSLTIAAALVSLALSKEVKKGVAVTGELTLFGKVLRAESIKQKVLLARRESIFELIIPEANRAQVLLLTDNNKKGMRFHFVSQFKQVYELLFSAQKSEEGKQVVNEEQIVEGR